MRSLLRDRDGSWSWTRTAVATGGALLLLWSLAPRRSSSSDPFKGNLQDPQDFGGFLRKPLPLPDAPKKKKYDSTSFGTFLKDAGARAQGGDAAERQRPSDPLLAGLPDKGLPVCVAFGTEYGFSKEIAQKLCQQLKERGDVIPKLIDMGDYPSGYDLASEQCLFVVCSTQGDGVPPAEARDFVEWLDKAPALPGLPFSVLALGDRNYEHFAACGKRVDAALEKLGGRRVVDRVDIDREDWTAIDGWLAAVLTALPTLGLTPVNNPFLSNEAPAQPLRKRFNRANPYLASVSRVRGLCNVSDKRADKDTVMVELDLGDSGIEYSPGDALGILPLNDPGKVAELLEVWGVDGAETVATPDWDAPAHDRTTLPLREALERCYDIREPKPEIFGELLKALQARSAKANGGVVDIHVDATNGHVANGHATNGHAANGHAANGHVANGHGPASNGVGNGKAADKEAILAKLTSSRTDAEQYLTPRHLVDLFREFCTLPVSAVLPCLRPLQPRMYSISSSMREDPRKVQVTIAVVRYESLGHERVGVCSTYCGERLEVGMRVPVYVSRNPDFRLPTDPAVPIIMVGPGTGLAPFRSFLKDRTLSGSPCGQALLYFGCRRRDQDYLYGDLLEAWHREGQVTLFTAFSREGAKKVYVQDRLAESAVQVWSLLDKGAHFYVCGDAGSMAGAVEKALLGIIAKQSGKGIEYATEYLAAMSAGGRYQRDVWF